VSAGGRWARKRLFLLLDRVPASSTALAWISTVFSRRDNEIIHNKYGENTCVHSHHVLYGAKYGTCVNYIFSSSTAYHNLVMNWNMGERDIDLRHLAGNMNKRKMWNHEKKEKRSKEMKSKSVKYTHKRKNKSKQCVYVYIPGVAAGGAGARAFSLLRLP
jgi:hypothetical protein